MTFAVADDGSVQSDVSTLNAAAAAEDDALPALVAAELLELELPLLEEQADKIAARATAPATATCNLHFGVLVVLNT